MREHESEFKAARAGLASIGLGDRNYARIFREETGITFPLLIDENRIAYQAAGLKNANLLHVFRRDNAAARQRARAGGFRQTKLGKNPFQLGGSFVFAPGNVDLYGYASKTFGDNPPIGELLKAVAATHS